DNVPALADDVIGPRIVSHRDAPVFGVAPGRDDCAAIARRVRRGYLSLLLLQPRQVVIRQLFERVKRDDVPAIDFDTTVIQTFDDSVYLSLKLIVNLRPKDFLRSLSIEVPVLLRFV